MLTLTNVFLSFKEKGADDNKDDDNEDDDNIGNDNDAGDAFLCFFPRQWKSYWTLELDDNKK